MFSDKMDKINQEAKKTGNELLRTLTSALLSCFLLSNFYLLLFHDG